MCDSVVNDGKPTTCDALMPIEEKCGKRLPWSCPWWGCDGNNLTPPESSEWVDTFFELSYSKVKCRLAY